MNTSTELRATLKLALPIAFAQVALMTMGLVDAAFVGRVSSDGLAAVAIGNSLFFALACPAMGVTFAVEPLASQAVGAGDQARAWAAFRAGLIGSLLLSVPTMLVVVAASYLLGVAGVDPTIVPTSRAFMIARLGGVPSWLIYMAAKAYLEARGVTRPLLVGAWLTNIVNVVVCSLLVFGDAALVYVGLPAVGLVGHGAVGAGVATTAANLCIAGYALLACYRVRPEGARLFARVSTEDREYVRKLLHVGVPIGFQLLTEVGVFALVSVLAGRLGAFPLAAHQIALGLASFTFMGVLGVSGATAVRVGRAIGASEAGGPRRAGLVGFGVVLVYMVLCATVFVAAPRALSVLFSRDESVLAIAVPLLRVAAFFQLADGIQGVAGGALRGAGDTRFASWANVVCHWGIGLPLAALFGLHLGYGAVGLWWGLCIGLYAVALVLFLRFLQVTRREIAAL
jgi:multidrug resistance protein, MATE family